MPDKSLQHYRAGVEPEEHSPLANLSMRDLYGTVFRHKKLVLFCAVLGIAVAIVIGLAQQHRYVSEAKLLVRFVQESVQLDPSSNMNSVIAARSWESVINSEKELLRSRELAEQVVAEFNAGRRPPENANIASDAGQLEAKAVAREIAHKTSRLVTAIRTGDMDRTGHLSDQEKEVLGIIHGLEIDVPLYQNILHVRLQAHDPAYAQQALNRLIELYLEKHMQVHRVGGAYEFFLEQTLKLEQEMEERQELLQHLKNKYQIASVQDQNRGMGERMAALTMDLKNRTAALAASNARLQVMEDTLLDLQQQLKDNPHFANKLTTFTNRTYDHLITLQLEEQDLLSTYTNESLPVKKVRDKIGAVRNILERGLDDSERPSMQVTSANEAYNLIFLSLLEEQQNQSALRAELDTLAEQKVETVTDFEFLNDGELMITRMQDQVDLLRANHRKYFEMAEQSRIDNAKEAEKIANISVIQAATRPLTPMQTEQVRYMAFAVVLGLLTGFGGAFASDKVLDHSLKTPEDVERALHVETLVSIPYVRSKRNLHILSMAEQEADADEAGENNMLWDLPPQIKDHYGALSERLLATTPDASKQPVIIGVTSWGRHEGVSTVAANLAVSLAERDGQVLLVDANLRNPKAQNFFGRKSSAGLSVINADGLGGQTTVLQHNLFLLPAGGEDEDDGPTETLTQKRSNEIMARLERLQRGYVVIDLPPLSANATAIRFARMAHSVLLVVEAEKNRREAIGRGKDMLQRVEANLQGVILNKRRYHIPNWIYQRI